MYYIIIIISIIIITIITITTTTATITILIIIIIITTTTTTTTTTTNNNPSPPSLPIPPSPNLSRGMNTFRKGFKGITALLFAVQAKYFPAKFMGRGGCGVGAASGGLASLTTGRHRLGRKMPRRI